jgi:copper chaperone NosL
MVISEKRFGAEIVTKKGKIYKYDAAECMLNYLSLGNIALNEIAGYYVIDSSNPANLINAEQAHYLISEKYPSPMGANLSAYLDKSRAEANQKEFGGELFTWNDLLIKFKVK